MAEIIIDIHSLSAATDWYFDDLSALDASNLEAVACFAAVSIIDTAYVNLGGSKAVIPLSADQLGQNLIGLELPDMDVVHQNALRNRFGA